MQRNHRPVILVQEQKACMPIHHRFYLGCCAVGDDAAETGCLFLTHRDIAAAAFCPWVSDHSCPDANCTHSFLCRPHQCNGSDTSHLYAGIHHHAKSVFDYPAFFRSRNLSFDTRRARLAITSYHKSGSSYSMLYENSHYAVDSFNDYTTVA